MPLKKGNSPSVVKQNIAEFHHGKTYAQTEAKHGKDVANKQAIAAAFHTANKGQKK